MKKRILISICLLFTAVCLADNLEIDTEELSIFFDGVINEQLIAYEIPGAVVSVVKDGKPVFQKGYGFADLEGNIPASADKTLFRIGSISKLFVWTAVMQMSENGMLDIHKDINLYLDEFKIPQTFKEPITMAHLMTHTPGFEEQELGVFVKNKKDIAPLGKYLAHYIPVRVRPPGLLSSYSNYGTALSAYIVEKLSGMAFYEYAEANIFQPLSMASSTYLQPPSEVCGKMAKGYIIADGYAVPNDFEWIQAYPAGSVSSTASDMANFMIACLNFGRFGEERIMEEATAMEMQSRHFAHDEEINGWTWGFMELKTGNHRILWHGGDTYLFHSAVYLIQDYNTGIFVSYNCPAGAKARIDLIKAFMARYLPQPEAAAPDKMDGPGHAGELSGSYLDIRTNYSTPEKLMTILNPVAVEMIDEHTLVFSNNRWIEIKPLVFRNYTSEELMVFKKNMDGKYCMFRGNNPTTAYTKIPFIYSPRVQKSIIAACFIIFISVVLLWPLSLAFCNAEKAQMKSFGRLTGIILWIICLLNSFFIYRMYRLISDGGFSFGLPHGINTLLILPYINVPLTFILIILLVLAWYKSLWNPFLRICFSTAAFFCMVSVWLMSYWNLLFFRF